MQLNLALLPKDTIHLTHVWYGPIAPIAQRVPVQQNISHSVTCTKFIAAIATKD